MPACRLVPIIAAPVPEGMLPMSCPGMPCIAPELWPIPGIDPWSMPCLVLGWPEAAPPEALGMADMSCAVLGLGLAPGVFMPGMVVMS